MRPGKDFSPHSMEAVLTGQSVSRVSRRTIGNHLGTTSGEAVHSNVPAVKRGRNRARDRELSARHVETSRDYALDSGLLGFWQTINIPLTRNREELASTIINTNVLPLHPTRETPLLVSLSAPSYCSKI
jgi:hypothetical protein